MTEKDLLFRLETICQWYREWSRDYTGDHILSPDEVGECMVYISSMINQEPFRSEDPEQWGLVKRILYSRLKKKSPQTMFELTLGLPNGVDTVILDEMDYGRMYQNGRQEIELRK